MRGQAVEVVRIRSARLYVANRRAKPMVRMLGSRMLRAASTASSLSPRRRHCRLDAAADERQEQVLQGVVGFPEFARIDVVDALPDFRLAQPLQPARAKFRS